MPARTADGPELLPETEELATGENFAAVTTVLPSGRLPTQLIWVDVEDGERARRQVDRLSRKYTGEDYPPDNIKSERVILRVSPERPTCIDQAKGIAD